MNKIDKMRSVTIRPVWQKDLGRLAQIYADVYKAFDVGERWDKRAAGRLMAYWFKRQPDLFFVAEWKEKVVGAAVAGIKPWCDGNHLVDGEIFVHPDNQNQGIGAKLNRVLLERALQKYNAGTIDAVTFRNHEFPLCWYKRLGFKEVGEWVIISGKIKDILEKIDKGEKEKC